MTHITAEQIIGQVVAQDYRTATVFKSFGIDFCCKGNRSIAEACREKQIDTEHLIEDLEKSLLLQQPNAEDEAAWPLDLLADYIEKKHHRYVQQRMPEIKGFLRKVVEVHGQNHPELIAIETLFLQSVGDLTAHMMKEENILFPYVRILVNAQLRGEVPPIPYFGAAINPVAMMMHEHDAEGERFRQIAALSNQYTPPAEACQTYQVAYALLKEFEADLHRHIHLENNILFPKAIALEKTFR